MKTIGIIGGMGPQATAELYMAVVGICQRRFGARYDADFPPMLIHSLPAPELVERLEDEQALEALLASSARGLQGAGAALLGIACNTAHIVLPRVREAVQIPVLDLPDEVAAAAAAAGHRRVGLLATGLTLDRGLYHAPCRRHGLQPIDPQPAQRQALTRVIMAVLAGDDLEAPRAALGAIIEQQVQDGASAVVLACTDLGAAARGLSATVPLLDSTEVLAEALIREAVLGSEP